MVAFPLEFSKTTKSNGITVDFCAGMNRVFAGVRKVNQINAIFLAVHLKYENIVVRRPVNNFKKCPLNVF